MLKPPNDVPARPTVRAQVALRPPRGTTDLFQLLSLYRAEDGLAPLLERVDLSGLTPGMLKDMVHGRRRLSTLDIVADAFARPADVLAAALLSGEFQGNVISSFLEAFPHLRRTVFFHIPKCLGTDLVANVGAGRLVMDKNLEESSWIAPAVLLERMGETALLAGQSDEVLVTGHLFMVDWLERMTVRPQDTMFTVIRDPIELLVSQANYAIGRLLQDRAGKDPDTTHTRDCLGIAVVPEASDTAALRLLAIRALQDERICQPNLICHHLSASRTPSYVGALAGALQSNLEIVTATTYQAWLSARWGVGPSAWHNRSDKRINRLDAVNTCRDYVLAATAQDRDFFDLVTWVLGDSGGHSIRIPQIMQRLGLEIFAGVPGPVLAERHRRGVTRLQGPDGLPDSAVARGKDATRDYVRGHPTHRDGAPAAGAWTDPASGLRIHRSLAFRVGGNAVAHLLSGWSPAESHFIWTVGTVSSLQLPRPELVADHVLQIVVEPFVVPDVLGSQTVEVRVNGETLGTAMLPEHAVLELAVPGELLQREPEMLIELRIPTARRPDEITAVADDRTLGVCITEMTIYAAAAATPLSDGSTAAPPTALRSVPPMPPHPPRAALTDAELVLAFESLGENCEFGLVQRRCGGEPLGLLRFASSPYPVLMRALKDRFADMGRRELLQVRVSDNGREYMLQDQKFGFLSHAWVLVGDKTADEVHQRECRRVPFLVRKLVEDLSGGEKIMVYHAMQPLTQAEAEALAAAIAEFGASTTLLWVELAEAGHPPGSVVRLGPNLLKGHVDRFAPGENAKDLSLDSWLAVCRQAHTTVESHSNTLISLRDVE